MSIRITALYIFVAVLLTYAWKDWFKSLCGLIFLMAVIEHEDMPKNLFGIQGLNLWNVLFLGILLAWMASRQREGLTWDMPRHVIILLLMYFAIILLGTLRAFLDRGYMTWYPLRRLISDELINTFKWVLPGILLFDGCRTRKRVLMALVCLLAMYLALSILVIRRMPIEAAYSYTDSIERTRVKLSRSVGYNACDISAFLAGVSWSVLATLQLVRKKKYWIIILGMAGIAILGQVLSGGRAGFVAWVGTGLTLCLLKWRKYLVLAPVVAILVPIIFPGVVQRMKLGFGQIDVAGQVTIDEQALLSGRAQVWPHVIDKIRESPLIGYGRLAMRRTGLSREVSIQEGQTAFAHPHNMYLEILLDNGILGSIPIFVFWGMVLTYSARLFRSTNHLCSAVGGLCLSLMLAQLIAGIGSQHFYPKESTMGMWIAIFLSIRVYVEKTRAHIYPVATESPVDAQRSQQRALVASACANGTIAR